MVRGWVIHHLWQGVGSYLIYGKGFESYIIYCKRFGILESYTSDRSQSPFYSMLARPVQSFVGNYDIKYGHILDSDYK